MSGWIWRFYLGAGAPAAGGYYLLSDGAGAVLNVVVGASAVAAIAAGIRWHRPPRRAAWRLIAAAQGLFVAGDALFSVNELVLGIEPFPSLADALYLPGYPVLATIPGRRPVAFRLLIASLEVIFAADMAFSLLALQGTERHHRRRLPGRPGAAERDQARPGQAAVAGARGQGDRVQLCIRDDGVGFDLPAAA